jgi:hypothetical protein
LEEKKPRIEQDALGFLGKRPVWTFSRFDHPHAKWGAHGESRASTIKVIDHLKNFESMFWREILKHPSCGPVDRPALAKDARDRLEELKIFDDELHHLRITGAGRLWGIRVNETFQILWWDPGHEICPSLLKHT